jgi:PAS domain-containing protein
MTRHLSLSQLTLLVVGIFLIGGLLILLIYVLHKAFQRQREAGDSKRASPRSPDEAAFAMATMQSVIAGLRSREKELRELLHDAEQRAEPRARTLESIVREMPMGLMVFNREGFLTLSNPAVRALLGIDTWSRRRYTEILGTESQLTAWIRECLETGKTCKREGLEYVTPRGETRTLGVFLSPCHGRDGQVESAVCLLTNLEDARHS